jgi:CheY-like chemotaxis protein
MEGMNGLELAKIIKGKSPSVPVIVVTGYPPADNCADVDAWLEKQDMFPALLDKIRLFLGEHDPQETLSA